MFVCFVVTVKSKERGRTTDGDTETNRTRKTDLEVIGCKNGPGWGSRKQLEITAEKAGRRD